MSPPSRTKREKTFPGIPALFIQSGKSTPERGVYSEYSYRVVFVWWRRHEGGDWQQYDNKARSSFKHLILIYKRALLPPQHRPALVPDCNSLIFKTAGFYWPLFKSDICSLLVHVDA